MQNFLKYPVLALGDQVSEFKQRNQRGSLGPHGCKHLSLKPETGFVARIFSHNL